MSCVCVKIDMERLAARLSGERGRPVGRAETSSWLMSGGLHRTVDSWYCDAEEGLELLKSDEILSRTREQVADGVTFIEPSDPTRANG